MPETIASPTIVPETRTAAPGQRSNPFTAGSEVYAGPVDVRRHGEYRITRDPADPRPLYRFDDRITAPIASPGRFHLYSGWFCPWAHRSTLVISLAGLAGAVTVSYVDGARDGRGWAFRPPTGPDPVNGFTLLRQAYEATEPGFDGHVSVPTLWDRRAHRVFSNDYATLDADLAAVFGPWSTTGVQLYPQDLRQEIDELDRWLGLTVNHGVRRATGDGGDGRIARDRLRAAFAALDQTFAHSRHLLGDRLTLADVRLFVTLVRYDVGANADGKAGPRLSAYPELWAYARDLYQQEAVRATTRIDAFAAPGARVPDWDEPVSRNPKTW